MQNKLSKSQIESFYQYHGDETQVENFINLVKRHIDLRTDLVVDIGGGVGFFATGLHKKTGAKVRIVDTDIAALNISREKGFETFNDDALSPIYRGDESVICFNLILHHLVGKNEEITRDMQERAIGLWKGKSRFVFVSEISYESIFKDLSGSLIYTITKSKFLSLLVYPLTFLIPSLKANTFKVGVRFRSIKEWEKIFENCGFKVVGKIYGVKQTPSIARRLLLIKSSSLDSWLLECREL